MGMKNFYKKKERDPNEPEPELALVSKSTSISKYMAECLQGISDEFRIPVSMLIARSVYNELNKEKPFEHHFEVPAHDSDEVTQVSTKVYDFIKKHPGLGIEHLIFCAPDMGLSKDDLLHSYRLLLNLDMIEEYYPINSKFPHPRNYRVSRRNPDLMIEKPNPKYRKIVPIEKGPLDDL